MKIAGPLFLVILTCSYTLSQSEDHSTVRAVAVHFVGCKSDGQLGPAAAPAKKKIAVNVSAVAATQHLAYYKAKSGPGVLAPRDWFCFGTYGSNGETLYVSPVPLTASELSSTPWTGLTGPVIEISHDYGGTSGRFAVAAVIARVFPDRRNFVEKIIAENSATDALPVSFVFGPYDKDILRYRNKNVVEFRRPANTDGLGTNRLRKNGDAVSGVVMLIGPDPDLIRLAVRLPSDKDYLKKFIIAQAELEASQPNVE